MLHEIIKKNKKASWLQMCTFYKINKWELINYLQVPVFPSRELIKPGLEVLTQKCYQCGLKLDIGLRLENFIAIKKCDCHSDGTKSMTRKKLSCVLNDDQIDLAFSVVNAAKKVGMPNMKEHWIKLGMSTEEAMIKAAEVQKATLALSPASKKGARGYSIRTKEYWIKKGFSEANAIDQVKKSQAHNGKEWYIKKYGDIGEQLFKDRIENWLITYYSKREIQTINKTKGRTKEHWINEKGLDWYLNHTKKRIEKIIQSKIQNGQVTDKIDLPERILYYEKVAFYTRHSLRFFFDKINPSRLKIGIRENHIDHIFSKNDAFLQNIPPEMIGCFGNLRVIPWNNNLSKGRKSEITKEELIKRYEECKNIFGWPY